MFTANEGSSREAGDKLPVPGAHGACIVSTARVVSQVIQIRESGSVGQVEGEAKASAMRKAKAFRGCPTGDLPCKAVRARLLKMAGNRLRVHRARATTKGLTGLVPVQE